MRNIFAIAQKELKAYFASPIAYVVIGLFALLFGYFYSAILSFFLRQSLQVGQFGFGGPTTINVNQHLIRPIDAPNKLSHPNCHANGDNA